MAGKKIRGKASEVGKLWSSSGQIPQNVRTWIGVIGPHYRRPLMDPKGIGPPANSKFHAFRPQCGKWIRHKPILGPISVRIRMGHFTEYTRVTDNY